MVRLTLLAFIVFIFFGVFDCTNLIMRSQMSMESPNHFMSDCIPGQNCGMDINTHISIWQGMTTMNLNTDFSSLIASILIAALVFGIYKMFLMPQTSLRISRYLYYDRDHRESTLYNYFVHIFSNGILQPKRFAL